MQPHLSTRAQEQMACPNCGALIPIHPHYVTWCDQCDWNLHADTSPLPATVFERWYLRLGQRLSGHLFATLNTTDLSPRLTPSLVAAIVLAGLTHVFTAMLAVGGVLILLRAPRSPVLLIAAGLAFGLVWLLRPQFNRLPSSVVSPTQCPTLYVLATRTAQAIGTRPPAHLAIDGQFNASFTYVGGHRQAVVTLGLPLLAVLEPQEQVALLAHELAHGANGDVKRGWFVGSAVDALGRWYALMHPDAVQSHRSRYGDGSPAGCLTMLGNSLANVLMRVLRVVPWMGLWALSHLLYRNTQRAEYLADALAARVAGMPATLGLLDKLHYTDTYTQSVQQLTVRRTVDLPGGPKNLLDLIRTAVAAMPDREVERLRRVAQAQGARIDVTHPPTAYRVRWLQAHPPAAPLVTVSDDEAARIEDELRALLPRIERQLIDQYRDQIYAA